MAATIRTIPVMIAHAATTYKRASAVIAGQATMTIPTTKLITPSAIAQASRPRRPATMLATPSTRAKAPSKITSTPTVGPGQTMAITPNSTAMNPRSAIAPQLRVIASSMSITSITILGENAPTRPRPSGGGEYHRRDGHHVGDDRRARAARQGNAHDERDGPRRRADPRRRPAHDGVYCATVHQSRGATQQSQRSRRGSGHHPLPQFLGPAAGPRSSAVPHRL